MNITKRTQFPIEGSLVPSFSGGKDSTYLVLRLHDLGYKMADIVYFDTGWEFPEMEEHIAKVEDLIKQKITRLTPREPFDYLFAQLHVESRGQTPYSQGYGWPRMRSRWCTREKIRAIDVHASAMTWRGLPLPIVQCIGYASDEMHRIEKHCKNTPIKCCAYSYPMVALDATEADALAYCRERGLDWGGLYDVFDRVSCYVCPLGGIASAKKLYQHYPHLWQRVLEMASWLPEGHPGIRYSNKWTVAALDKRFYNEQLHEERMIRLPDLPEAVAL